MMFDTSTLVSSSFIVSFLFPFFHILMHSIGRSSFYLLLLTAFVYSFIFDGLQCPNFAWFFMSLYN
jgi:hypothetical protein